MLKVYTARGSSLAMVAMLETVNIHNVPISNLSEAEFLVLLQEFLEKDDQRIIFFANAHVLNVAQTNQGLMQALKGADLVLTDGMGLKIAGKVLGHPIKANLNGTDLLPKVLSVAVKEHLKVFFLGGEPGIPEQAKSELQKRIPQLCVVGVQHGFFSQEEVATVLEQINESKADILLVGLGVPFQEKWIWQFQKKLRPKLLCGVGAFLDFSAGRFPRAPLYLQQMGLEWLFRLYQEPQRLFHRYIFGNATFLFRTFKQRFGQQG